MEENVIEKMAKVGKRRGAYALMHVSRETRRKIIADLQKVNRKNFGYHVWTDQYLRLAISKIGPEDLRKLQEESLTNADRLARDYRNYVAKHGSISKDEYLGKLLRREIVIDQGSADSPISTGGNS